MKIVIEIVDLPSYKMVIFHSYVSLPEGTSYEKTILLVLPYGTPMFFMVNSQSLMVKSTWLFISPHVWCLNSHFWWFHGEITYLPILVGGLEHFVFSIQLGISSSQLTNSYFSETTNQYIFTITYPYLPIISMVIPSSQSLFNQRVFCLTSLWTPIPVSDSLAPTQSPVYGLDTNGRKPKIITCFELTTSIYNIWDNLSQWLIFIFQDGWNHQPDIYIYICVCVPGVWGPFPRLSR